MDRFTLARSVPHTLSVSLSDKDLKSPEFMDDKGRLPCRLELCDNAYNHSILNQTDGSRQSNGYVSLWKEKVVSLLLFSGNESLCIYLLHGVFLNILKTKTTLEFSSISGVSLVFANYIICVLLCVVIIRIFGSNRILCRFLGVKGKKTE